MTDENQSSLLIKMEKKTAGEDPFRRYFCSAAALFPVLPSVPGRRNPRILFECLIEG
jgi:hypothetical protein